MDVAVIGPELSNCLVATLSFGLHGSLAVTLGARSCKQTCIGSQGIQSTSRSTTAFGHRCGELIQYHSWVKLGKEWGRCFLGHHRASASPLRPSCRSPASGGEQEFGPCGILPWFVLAVTLSSCSEQKQQKSCGFPVRVWRVGPAQLPAHCEFLASHEIFLFLSFHICLLGVVRCTK